jgi:serine/threonine protein kinase/Tol biopolymer transport system component
VPNDDVLTRVSNALADRYRIERELGAGGMATVLLAHDLKHDRDVAIKVLHPDLGAALGGERFLSEIRTTARLQHPHILPLLDSGSADGLLYYVMPLVTGETLRARLEREKQLPVDDALRIALEVADALAYAHDLGVIHRDIKPENILLQGGHASVADFGIALAVQQAGGQRMTQTGLSLGTPQYMSPEQAMGERTVDARSDLYSLAAVTYEMLAGEAPFTGPTVQAIVARVMTEEPRSLVTQRKAVPDYVDDAVMRALEKLPADRWGTVREFAGALRGGAGATPLHTRTGAPRRNASPTRGRLKDPVVIGLAGVALASLLFAAWQRRPVVVPETSDVVRFNISMPQNERANSLGYSTLAISLDGRSIVYLGQDENRRQMLMVRRLDDVNARALPGTEGAGQPTFSPDGKWIAFVRGNQVFKVEIDGGKPQLLAAAPGLFSGMSWSSTGVIVISGNVALYTIPEGGGTPHLLGKSEGNRGLEFMPLVVDEMGLVLYTSATSTAIATNQIAMMSLATGERTLLDVQAMQPLGIVDGALIYVTASGALMGIPFDVRNRRITGAAVQLGSDIAVNLTAGMAQASLAHNGTLFYQGGAQTSRVVSVGIDGTERMLLAEPGEYAFPRLSPDGRQLALTIGALDRRAIWVCELGSQTMTPLTTDGSASDRPEWSSDGKRVLYRSDRVAGSSSMWWRPADLSTDATPLLSHERVYEAVMSPDMHTIAYQLDTLGADVFYRRLDGDTTAHAIANNPKAIEIMPRLSPDGKWIAFTTDESGHNDVVVQPFPGPGGRVHVSASGGTEPVWSRDGNRLFYRNDGRLMAATRGKGSSFVVVSRDTVLSDVYQYAPNPHANFDVTADGKHFVFLKTVGEGALIVAANWKAVLRERMKATR